jgi:hypothetical protein
MSCLRLSPLDLAVEHNLSVSRGLGCSRVVTWRCGRVVRPCGDTPAPQALQSPQGRKGVRVCALHNSKAARQRILSNLTHGPHQTDGHFSLFITFFLFY